MANKIYKRHCDNCGKYYEGAGRYFCSMKCSNRVGRFSQETIKKMKESQLARKERDGYLNSPANRKKHSERMKGENNSNWINRTIDIICDNCGKKFRRGQYGLNRFNKNNFCNQKCKSEWQKENLSGKNNPNWQSGKSFEPYSSEFNEQLKEQIRQRDGYRCQQCFRHQDELFSKKGRPYKLHIHHIDYNKRNNNPDNLISLCNSCHCQTNYKRDDWIEYFQNKLIN